MGGAVEIVHATCVALDGRGILIRGKPGAGKSDLALRCLMMCASPFSSRGFQLVADDQVVVERNGGCLVATAPPVLRGKLEVRGHGIIDLCGGGSGVQGPTALAERAEIALIVDICDPGEAVERLPDPVPTADLLGCLLPLMRLHAFEASAPAKLAVALTHRYG